MEDKAFRNAMGKFATGVTIITSKVDGDIFGMTANAFMSVSLKPKLILVSIDNRANMLEKIKTSNTFAVNILSDKQKALSMHFAGQQESDEAIEFDLLQAIPILKHALASIVCKVDTSFVAGDHTLFIGHVIDLVTTNGSPLTFYRGKYGIGSVVS